MKTPDLFSRARRAVPTEDPDPAPSAPTIATVVERKTLLPNGDVEHYVFDGREETTRIILAADAHPSFGTDATRASEDASILAQLEEAGVR